jgi:DNA-directed RNA polymerase subunit RPC12/RpoP
MSKLHPWVLTKADRSHCPHCHHTTTMLSRIDLPKPPAPMFYICFRCQRIFEAGVGECIYLTDEHPKAT